MPVQIKQKSSQSRRTFFFLFLPGVSASHVYVRAWTLRCFHGLIGTQTFRRALTPSVDSFAEIKSDLWWCNQESDAGSVVGFPGIGHVPLLEHPSDLDEVITCKNTNLSTSSKGYSSWIFTASSNCSIVCCVGHFELVREASGRCAIR